MKKLSIYLLISVAICLPLDAASSKRKVRSGINPNYASAMSMTHVIDQQPSAHQGNASIDIGILPHDYEFEQNGHQAYKIVIEKADEVLKTLNYREKKSHDYSQLPLSSLRRIAQSRITLLQKAQELASADTKNDYLVSSFNEKEATILGIKKALSYVMNAEYPETKSIDSNLHSEDGLAYFDAHFLKEVPHSLKEKVKKLLALEFASSKTLYESDIKKFVTSTGLPKDDILAAYNNNPLLKVVCSQQEEIKPEPAYHFMKHAEKFNPSLAKINCCPTSIASIKFHGACYYKDPISGDIISMEPTKEKPDSQDFKTAHSKGMGAVMGEKQSENISKIMLFHLSEEKNELINIILPSLEKAIATTVKTLNELEKDAYQNAEKITRQKEILQDQRQEHAAATALAQRSKIDREIQEFAYRQMELNSESAGKTMGFVRGIAALGSRLLPSFYKTTETPQIVWKKAIFNQANAYYEQEKALYDQRTQQIQETAEAIAGLAAERKKIVTEKETVAPHINKFLRKSSSQHDKRHGYRVTTAQEEPYEFRHAHYATTSETWALQEPSMAKILKKLLPTEEFQNWLQEEAARKQSHDEALRQEREQAEARAIAAKKLEEASQQLNAASKKQ